MGRWEEAEPLYLQAQAIRQQVVGEQHPDYAASLNNLAGLYHDTGQWQEAEPLLRQAQAIQQQALGERHPDYALSLHNLAALYQAMGRWEEAEPLLRQAQAIRQQVLGEWHPDYGTTLSNLAVLLAATTRYDEAWRQMQESTHIHNRLLARLATALPERQLLAFARTLAGDTSAVLTLVWHCLRDDADTRQAALDLVLARKVIAYEVAAAQQHAALAGAYPELQAPFAHLRRVRTELARRALCGPTPGETVAQHEERLSALEYEGEQLEQRLATQVPDISSPQ